MRPLLEQNHYEILEVPLGCDAGQVERAYHIARSTYGTDSIAAYSIFSDDDSRAILERIEEAAGVVDADRLSVSPQCGFASVAGGNVLTEDDERAKLRLVVETAERAWGTAG